MSEELALPTEKLLLGLREMYRQWVCQGSRLNVAGRLPPASGGGNLAPICQAIEVTSSTADTYGYPARIQTYDGTNWSDTYEACRAVQIGSTIAGAVLATGFYPIGRLMYVSPTGLHVYGVHSGSVFTAQEVDASPSTTTTLKFPNTSLTDNGDGTVTVKSASVTESGLVSVATQEFGGLKIGNVGLGAGVLAVPIGSAELRFGKRATDAGGIFINSTGGGGGALFGLIIEPDSSRVIAQQYVAVTGLPDTTAGSVMRYSVRDQGVLYDGITGNGAAGDFFYGGLYTGPGSIAAGAASDAAFTEAAQDAIGAMVDSTLTYTDATPLLKVADAGIGPVQLATMKLYLIDAQGTPHYWQLQVSTLGVLTTTDTGTTAPTNGIIITQ